VGRQAKNRHIPTLVLPLGCVSFTTLTIPLQYAMASLSMPRSLNNEAYTNLYTCAERIASSCQQRGVQKHNTTSAHKTTLIIPAEQAS